MLVLPFFRGDFRGVGRQDLLAAMIYTHILTGAVVSFAALQEENPSVLSQHCL